MSSGKITHGTIELSTNFSVNQDIKILINTLKNRFGLVCSIDVSTKNLYVIIVSKESVQILQNIVSPYIIPNFRYKIGLNNRSHSVYHKTLLGYYLGNRFYSTSNNPLQNSFAASYPNPVLLKSVIYKENLKKAGIYRWTNLITGDTYIGSSINLTGRFVNYFSTKHLIRIVKRSKSIITSALLKYGHSNFKLEVLEYCDPKVLISREQHFLDLYQPSYNILTKAGSRINHTEESLAKFKLRKLSKESTEKLRSHLLNLNRTQNIKKRIKVDIHDFSTDITTTYESVFKASKAINSNSKSLLEREKYDHKSIDIIPYKGRYVITILREGITRADHLKKVELAKNNLSKGLTNWENASVKGVVVTNVITNDSVSYNTIIDAARALNVSRKTISRRLKDQKVLNYLYKISYA